MKKFAVLLMCILLCGCTVAQTVTPPSSEYPTQGVTASDEPSDTASPQPSPDVTVTEEQPTDEITPQPSPTVTGTEEQPTDEITPQPSPTAQEPSPTPAATPQFEILGPEKGSLDI